MRSEESSEGALRIAEACPRSIAAIRGEYARSRRHPLEWRQHRWASWSLGNYGDREASQWCNRCSSLAARSTWGHRHDVPRRGRIQDLRTEWLTIAGLRPQLRDVTVEGIRQSSMTDSVEPRRCRSAGTV